MIDKDKVRSRLDQLCQEDDSTVLDDIHKFQRGHAAFIGNSYGRYVSQIELAFSLLIEIAHGINYTDKSGWPKHRSLQFVLMVHNLKSIESILTLLVKGSYDDAIQLIRGPYEAFLRIAFISCFPADPYAGIGKAPKGSRQFNATNFLKQDLRLQWTDYELMSVFSHANQFTALSHVISLAQGRDKGPVAVNYKFDDKRFEAGANLLHIVVTAYLLLVVEIFTEFSATENAEFRTMLEKARELAGLFVLAFGEHPRPYLRRVVEDVEDIVRLVKWADALMEWHEAWAKIRLIRVISRRIKQISSAANP